MTGERSPAPGEFLIDETEDGRTRVEWQARRGLAVAHAG